ncbi:spermine synthase [Dokdonella sp.]|uniref:spermine/spermidine synthase domain-containing protein n=1 Tax=Dokdonella sp. TaxID=2291710 RepID=UPI003782D971
MSEDRGSRWLGPAALFVFALSGCAGLIYQSIWSQYLGLYLGHAAYAQSLVLAIFMGGMAIGAWWASRRSLQWRNLLRAYAAIELVIGVAAALFHPIYLGVTGFAYDSAFPAMPGSSAVQLFKWTSGALLILPQAILLGTTFPLMSNGLMRRLRKGDGAILGGLYFTNSMGAAIGALFATFVLLPAVGLPGAMRFGAALNLVVAIAAWLLARSPEQPQAPMATTDTPQDRSGIARLLLVAAFITGATSFVYEIGWVRMLSLAFGSTVHAFELMLAAFIGGLAFGGLWIRKRIDGYAQPIRVGGWVQIGMGIAALASLMLYDRSFDWVAWFMKALSRSDGGYTLYNFVTASVSMLLMAPAAFFAGMTLPLFTFALLHNGGGEASVGRIYAANTVGAIVGVFAAVHFLVPVLGLKLAMCIGAAGDLALGLVLLRRTGASARVPDARYLWALAGCAAALVATLTLARFDADAMSSGVYRSGFARMAPQGVKVLSYRDGKTASVSTRVYPNGLVTISTNGKVDAGIQMAADAEPTADESTMILAGVLPLMHKTDARTAAVIGFGSGLTTHTLLGDPRLASVDTIEIEPAMIEGAHVFGQRVARAFTDPRSHLHIEDAKTYFAAHRARYDIIVAEPSNPWVSGVAGLFSREFYHFVPRHLESGGLFVQWLQLYEINEELVASVANALSASFQDYRIYLSNNTDMLIVARADGMVGDLDEGLLQTPVLKEELERVGIGTKQDVLAHQIGDRRSLEPLFEALSSRMTSDFHPTLSLEAPKTRFTVTSADALLHLPVADLPYRAVVGRLPPATATVENPIFDFSKNSHAAVRLADALESGKLSTRIEDLSISSKIALARTLAGACNAPESMEGPLADTLVDLAARTIPYLPRERAQALWTSPTWISCDHESEGLRSLLTIISALARQDWPTVQHSAADILPIRSRNWSLTARDWLLRAAMLGALANGDAAAVESIDRSLGRTVSGNGMTLAYRAYMLALADRARHEAASDKIGGHKLSD